MVTLRDVIDTRTDKHHSVVIVSDKNVKWFVPAHPVVEDAGIEPEEEIEEDEE